MTARYRCPYCARAERTTLTVRVHMIKRHRNAVLDDLRVVDGYGVSGEGDTDAPPPEVP